MSPKAHTNAFPTHHADGLIGLNKREYFAAAALTGILASGTVNCTSIKAAEYAVTQADALLAELDKREGAENIV